MKLLPLSNGMHAMVDDEDFERLSRYRWHYSGGYAQCEQISPSGTRERVKLHRDVMAATPGLEVDHRFGNGLDCRKRNLRVCTHSQNVQNKRRRRTGFASQYKGVSLCVQTGKWRSKIRLAGKQFHLGYFESERRAAEAYNSAAIEKFGEFACLNKL